MFTRVNTAPAGTFGFFPSRSTASDRTRSIADASIGLAREQLQLFLAGNQIRSLPRELFGLDKLTVLILRESCFSYASWLDLRACTALPGANQLTHLPPEIAHLTNLRELNVSNNRLQYLPSEMSTMTLHQLHLHPNPFFLPPPFQQQQHSSRSSLASSSNTITDRPVSLPSHPLPHTIPLVELSFRALFSHYFFPNPDPSSAEDNTPPEPNDTVLATTYPLPLEGWDIPQPLKATLEICVPGSTDLRNEEGPSVARPPAAAARTEPDIMGIGVCPSPRHHHRTVFARHAEERFTWEQRVAGVSVGGAVPLRWRGCQWGCLDFLGGTGEVSDDEGAGGSVSDREHDSDTERSDEGKSEMVQLVQLPLGGFDEFDD